MSLRTDQAIVQLPAALPNFGGLVGKNTIQTDPDFQTKIVRATDASDNSNNSLQTSDGPESPLWNTNDTMLLCKNNGGVSFLLQFDPKKLVAKNSGLKFKGKIGFSKKSPHVLYQLTDGHLLQKVQLTAVKGVFSIGATTDVADFATKLPTGFKVNWVGSLNIAQDDNTFAIGFSEGIQETCFTVIAWRKGKGFRVLNTQTGQITGDWGTTGKATLTTTAYNFPFTLHEGSISPNPDIALFTISPKSGGGRFYWKVDSNTLVDLPVSGHAARGYAHLYAGGPGGGQIAELSYTNPPVKRLIVPSTNLPSSQVPPQTYDGDSHFGFGKPDKNDNAIFWVSSQSQTYPFTAAFMNEVRGYNAQTGIVSRACHTFNSGKANEFIVKNAVCVPSQTGKFIAFASDMMGALGSTSGAAKGTLGVDCRGDVFIVQIA